MNPSSMEITMSERTYKYTALTYTTGYGGPLSKGLDDLEDARSYAKSEANQDYCRWAIVICSFSLKTLEEYFPQS